MPKAPTEKLPDRLDPNASVQDDPPAINELERLRAKLARHNKEAEQLAEAMRRKPKDA